MDITELTVHELVKKLDNNEVTSKQIVDAYTKRINEKEKDVKAFITLTTDDAIKQAEAIDKNGRNK